MCVSVLGPLQLRTQVSLEEFSAAVERRKPKKHSANGRRGSVSGDRAWSAILAKIDENPYSWERSVQMLFRTFDRDGSGEVDISELAAGLKGMGVALAPDMVMALRDELDAVSGRLGVGPGLDSDGFGAHRPLLQSSIEPLLGAFISRSFLFFF